MLKTIPAAGMLCGLLLCGGCGTKRHEDPRQVFNYNEINGITSLDPAAAVYFENIWGVNLLFNGLVQMSDSLKVIPAIARSYSISTDGREYAFLLRKDVNFHDNPCFSKGEGRRVTAGDFEFSFNRLFDTRVSSASSLLDKVAKTDVHGRKGFEAINDSTFVIRLAQPFSAFLNILTMKYFSVVPPEAIAHYHENFRKHPVGTGPFVFKSWDEGNKLIMVKNPRYFERDSSGTPLPYLDAVTVSFIRDRETAFMEFLNGRFDMLSGADAFNINEVLDKEGRLRDIYTKKFHLQKARFLKTDYIGILVDENLPIVQQSALKHRAIRQAVNYAIDRRKLIKYLRNNIGVPATAGFIPAGMKAFDEEAVKGYHYDPARVKQLLAEAGYPGGKGLPPVTLHVSDTYKEQVEFIQSQLQRNNIPAQVSIEKASVQRDAVNRSEYLLFKKSWVADYPDEENFMSMFYSRNFSPQGVNYFHYRNERFDELYERCIDEKDENVRLELFRQMDRLVVEDAPVITLYYDEVIRLVSNRISGLPTNPMNLLQLKRTKKSVEK